MKAKNTKFFIALFFGLILGGCDLWEKSEVIIDQSSDKVIELSQQIPEMTEEWRVKIAELNPSELLDYYNNLKAQAEVLKIRLQEAKSQGEERVEDVQAKLEATQQALVETQAALKKLSETSQSLKDSVIP